MTSEPEAFDAAQAKARIGRLGRRSPLVYEDARGHACAGRGCRLDRPDARERLAGAGVDLDALLAGDAELSDEQVEALLAADLETALTAARSTIPAFGSMAPLAQQLAVDLLFNFGTEATEAAQAARGAAGDDGPGVAVDGSVATRWYDQPAPPA